jgi:flagellar biosynthesis protein FliR
MLNIHISSPGIATYLAILLRLSVVVFMFPPLSNAKVPFKIKAAVVVALASLLYPLLHLTVAPLPLQPGALMWAAVGEIIFGIVLVFALLVILARWSIPRVALKPPSLATCCR